MNGPAVDGTLPPIGSVQSEIIAEMAGLENPLDKYEYLVGLGRALDVRDGAIRQEAYVVPGCQSRVWIKAELRDGRLWLQADSEAVITRGIISLLIRVLDGRTPAEIIQTDLVFLDETGLRAHLSPSRANGLASMVRRIRGHAEEAAGGE
jgi:cysteine desulfuration protein SufE